MDKINLIKIYIYIYKDIYIYIYKDIYTIYTYIYTNIC